MHFHDLHHTAATIPHEETGYIEIAQRSLGHARRSTTEDIYDYADLIVDETITGLLLDTIVPDLNTLLSDAVN